MRRPLGVDAMKALDALQSRHIPLTVERRAWLDNLDAQISAKRRAEYLAMVKEIGEKDAQTILADWDKERQS